MVGIHLGEEAWTVDNHPDLEALRADNCWGQKAGRVDQRYLAKGEMQQVVGEL